MSNVVIRKKLPYEDGKFDLVTAVETVYFWPNLPDCLQEVRRVLKQGGKFAILVEVVDGDSMWTNVVEGMTAYSPEELKICRVPSRLSRLSKLNGARCSVTCGYST